MAIYTKGGDRGKTSLLQGKRVWKDNPRVFTCGTIDELNSHLGFAVSLLRTTDSEVKDIICSLQKDLFEIASEIATPLSKKSLYQTSKEKVRRVENLIDKLEGELPALGNFIFPGGTPPGAAMHIARSVSRRAERAAVRLSKKEEINENVLFYLNRISDLLFMLARKINIMEGQQEQSWKS